MEYTRVGHSAYYMKYHVVWVCKYRRKILKPGVTQYLRTLLPALLERYEGAELEQLGFDRDHLHMLISIPPRYAVADVMKSLKSQSAKQLLAVFPWVRATRYGKRAVWSPGYCVSTAGNSVAAIHKYVEQQGLRDSKREKLDL